MEIAEKKLGLLVASPPQSTNFHHALGLAEAGLKAGARVYWYGIDEGVRGIPHERLQALRESGLNLFACAYGAEKRGLDVAHLATLAGLITVADLVSATDRFLHFN